MIDSRLQEGSVATRDPASPRARIARQRPSALRSCPVLRLNPHEAEDLHLATFFIPVRRSSSIRDPERLVGVARKVADEARRRRLEARSRDAVGLAGGLKAFDPPFGRLAPFLSLASFALTSGLAAAHQGGTDRGEVAARAPLTKVLGNDHR